VPASPFETPGATLDASDVRALIERHGALGVAEVMNFPGVIAGEPEMLARIAAAGHRRVDGHSPGVGGRALDAYLAAGVESDHECTRLEEARERRRKGMWVFIRQGSASQDLDALIGDVIEHGSDLAAFCTDDREPDTLMREGHIDAMCRQAVAEGVAPEDALLMATLHPARCHGLAELGAIAPGYHADLVVLDDLESFRASVVIAGGEVAARDGHALPFAAPPVPGWVRDSVRAAPLAPAAFDLGPAAAAARIRVIDIVAGQLITGAAEEPPPVRDGRVVADPGRDLAKLAVIERHHATGRVGVGLVRGFGLRSGAFASTVAHDAHNLVVAGVDDASMAACAECLVALGGGIAVADRGVVRGALALPVAGLLSEAPAEAVVESLDALVALLREQGVEGEAPFMTLSFLALSVIPDLKLTDRGLVDVVAGRIVPLVV
jgi:adenine deaminase